MTEGTKRGLEPWDGGYARTRAGGKKTYYIRKRINGRLYELSTHASTLKAAYEQLKLFEADPEAYAAPKAASLYLDEKLRDAYLEWCTPRNSKVWLSKQRRYVKWWSEKLKGLDLRKVKLGEHIKPALLGAKAQAHRIAVIKAIYAWLREELHVITPAEDPCLGALKVPQTNPAQWKKSKVVTPEQIEGALRGLRELGRTKDPRRTGKRQHWVDALTLQLASGWHVSEVGRFCAGGEIESYFGPQGAAGVLVCPRSKAGDELRTAVDEATLEAARRLRNRGKFSAAKYGLAIRKACELAGVEAFTPGRMRHTVATNAIEQGASLAEVSTFLNHKSPATTKRFYATLAVAKNPLLSDAKTRRG